jgi:excisionase family DNA binding protein
MTLEDVALRLNVTPAYVRVLIRNGSLPVIWFGHKVKRVDAKAVDELIRVRTFRDGNLPAKNVALKNLEAARRVLRSRRPKRDQAEVTTIESLEAAEQALRAPVIEADELEL